MENSRATPEASFLRDKQNGGEKQMHVYIRPTVLKYRRLKSARQKFGFLKQVLFGCGIRAEPLAFVKSERRGDHICLYIYVIRILFFV